MLSYFNEKYIEQIIASGIDPADLKSGFIQYKHLFTLVTKYLVEYKYHIRKLVNSQVNDPRAMNMSSNIMGHISDRIQRLKESKKISSIKIENKSQFKEKEIQGIVIKSINVQIIVVKTGMDESIFSIFLRNYAIFENIILNHLMQPEHIETLYKIFNDNVGCSESITKQICNSIASDIEHLKQSKLQQPNCPLDSYDDKIKAIIDKVISKYLA